MPKDKKVTDLIEWTTIPYRTIRFWVILLALIVLLAGLWYLRQYGLPSIKPAQDSSPEMLEKRASRFVYIDGDVKVKPTGSIEWVAADQSKQLYPGDLIKTSFNSSCRIVFFDGTVYEVKPNSLISILESYQDRGSRRRLVNVELTKGALDLSTSQKNIPASRTKVETSNTVADLAGNTRASASFDPRVGDTRLKVAQGGADVTSKDSRQSIRVTANEEANIGGQGVHKIALPPPPVLVAPMTSEIFPTNSPRSLRITLRWRVADPRYTYRVSISTHPQFYQLLQEEMVKGKGALTITDLPRFGNYYWRVVAIDENNIEGYPSDPAGMFAIKPRKLNPSSAINFKLEKIVPIGDILEVIGRTDPDNLVTINGRMVLLEKDGSFKHFTDPIRGATARLNIVVKDYSGAEKRITQTVRLE